MLLGSRSILATNRPSSSADILGQPPGECACTPRAWWWWLKDRCCANTLGCSSATTTALSRRSRTGALPGGAAAQVRCLAQRAPFAELPMAFKRRQTARLRQAGGDREMAEILALVSVVFQVGLHARLRAALPMQGLKHSENGGGTRRPPQHRVPIQASDDAGPGNPSTRGIAGRSRGRRDVLSHVVQGIEEGHAAQVPQAWLTGRQERNLDGAGCRAGSAGLTQARPVPHPKRQCSA